MAKRRRGLPIQAASPAYRGVLAVLLVAAAWLMVGLPMAGKLVVADSDVAQLVALAGFVIAPSALVWSGLWVLGSIWVRPLGRAALAATAGYALVGVFFLVRGVGDYVGPGDPLTLLVWPFYVIWLHACILGDGLWACASG